MDDRNWREIYDSIEIMEGNDVIQYFLDAGLDINAHSYFGDTMLAIAAACGNMEVIGFLLQNGADANLADSDGLKPFHIAALRGHKNAVQCFLNIGIDIDSPESFGETMLHNACETGHFDIVRCLLSNGCNINAKNCNGCTPLHHAARFSLNSEIVEYLVEAGADVNCRSRDGRNALHFACKKRFLDRVKYLIKKRCDPNVQDEFLNTPLHLAVRSGYLEIIRHLLTVGADFNLENARGVTPFSLFIQNPLCLENITIFLEKGAYFQSDHYNFIIDEPSLKEGILQDVKICTQSVLNKFNYSDLPKMYERLAVAIRLPPIEKMKISSQCTRAHNIAEMVNYEIKSKGYCNVLNVRINILYCMCVRYLA